MDEIDREKPLVLMILFLVLLILSMGIYTIFPKKEQQHIEDVRERQPGVEEASFMLECVYEFSLEPEQCRAILDGGDPPKSPWKDGC